MSGDDRMSWGLIMDVLKVLERHGFHGVDNQHTGQAIWLLGGLARTYEGTLEAPASAYLVEMPPSRQAGAEQPRTEADKDAVVLSAAEVKTIVAALDEAALYKRDRVETCADCADQSCGTCQWRLQAAETYDRLAVQMLETAEASKPALGKQTAPASPKDDVHEGHRLWPHIQGWASELGLTGSEAIAQASQPPGDIHRRHERASGQPDLEAAD